MIKICNDRSVFPNSVKISNQYENKTRVVAFDLSDVEFKGNVYLVCRYQDTQEYYTPLLLNENNSIPVETFLSAKAGIYECLIVISNVTITPDYNFSDDNPMFVSNSFILSVTQNYLSGTSTQWELSPAIKNYFDELIALVNQVQEDLDNGNFVGNGIKSITLISTVGLVDTYQILFTNNETFDFQVTNGATPTITIENGIWFVNGISTGVSALGQKGDKGDPGVGIVSIEKTSTSGNVDTYTITFTNQTTSTFTVTNGTNGKDGVTPNIQIGTVTTLPAGSQATASITGTIENPLLNLGIPEGEQGSGGTTNYNDLENKPSINGVELIGNKTSGDLKMYTKEEVDYLLADKMDKPYTSIEITDDITLSDCLEGNLKIDMIKGNTVQKQETDIMPTPDRPVPINSRKVLANDSYVELRSLKESKNLFDKNLLVANSSDTQKSSLTIQLKDKETYTISCSKNGIECILGVRATKKSDGSDSEIMLLRGTTEQGSFTADYTTYENYFIIIYQNAYDMIDTVQLEHGSVATAYVQATVRDYKIVDHVTKTSKIVRNVGLYVDDKTGNNWTVYDNQTFQNSYFKNIKDMKRSNRILSYSNSFEVVNENTGVGNANSMWIGVTNSNVFVIRTDFKTIEEWKTWLKNNDLEFLYPLETPTEEEITYSASDTNEVGYSWQDTTSPSPTIKSEINGVEEIDILKTGKNLFDFSKVKETDGLTIDYENKTITIMANTNNAGYVNNLKDLMGGYKIGEKYVMSAKTSNAEAQRIIYFLDIKSSIKFDEPFTLTEEMLNSPFAWYNNIESKNQNVISNIQIELGETATPYEPYTGQYINITPPQPLYSTVDGSVADEVDGEKSVYRYWLLKDKLENLFNSVALAQKKDEFRSYYATNVKNIELIPQKVKDIEDNNQLFCDSHVAKLQFYNTNQGETFSLYKDDSGKFVGNINVNRLNEDSYEYIYNFIKDFEVVYPLLTPIEIPIPEEDLAKLKSLKTGQGVNNIFIGGEIKPSIEARYPQDVVLAVNRLQNKLLTLQEEVVKNV